jgi:uncharacterized protein with HEPN domain
MSKAEMLLSDVAYGKFVDDFRINIAVVRALEIVGEASKRIPSGLRDRYPEIPCKGMAGMGDRIIHGCDNVDLEIVWGVVKQDIPRIKPLVMRILADNRE